VASARLVDRTVVPAGPAPTRVRIPSIAVDAPVAPVGVDATGQAMAIPAEVGQVGWFRFGPSPGASGSAILVGHVDSRVQGAGVFFRLSSLEPGAVVMVTFGDGSVRRFEVTGRRSYPKADLPDEVFARDGAPTLALVTCGGPFDAATGHYRDNVVVYAVPAG
jgi:sortase (surface protein transpeptidase)